MALDPQTLEKEKTMNQQPLAERLRPKNLEEYIGQEHLLGKQGPIRKFIQNNRLPSLIFWGPPGVGKTSLAQLLSENLNRNFYALSAVNAGVKEVRAVIESAEKSAAFDQYPPILFIDEIHRFSKSQQDSLLAAVEKGIVVLIGATTENPSFEVISPLLSRCQVYTLKHLEVDELKALVDQALSRDEWLKEKRIEIAEYEKLLSASGGDARKLLNLLENIANLKEDNSPINNDFVAECISNNPLIYDKDGEQHYDVISAFIKSIRGSDPNAALYWLARMIEGGEDPKFIARRLVISASEDIGLANPNALLLATQSFTAIEQIGMPEGRIILSQCTVYLACSAKSNASYMAIDKARAIVRETGNLSVPMHLRNAPTKLMKELGYGEDYKYPHDYPGGFAAQDYMPTELSKQSILTFGSLPREQELKKFCETRWKDKYKF